MKIKKFNLKREFLDSWNYVKLCRNYIWFIVGIFLLFAIFGFFIKPSVELEKQVLDLIKRIFEQTQGMSVSQLIRFIFFNNLQSSFFGLIFGIILGVFPVLVALANGYLLGFVASKSVAIDGILSLWKIFPHGIFELPAVFISLGMGIKLGTFIFQKKKIDSLNEFFFKSLKTFLFVVIPLLIVAATIESFLVLFVS